MKYQFIFTAITGSILILSLILPQESALYTQDEIPRMQTPKIKVIQLSTDSFFSPQFQKFNDFKVIDASKDYITIFVKQKIVESLKTQNLPFIVLYNSEAEFYGWTTKPQVLRQFHDYPQLTTELQNIADNYPAIATLYDLGTSVQGRSIWGLKISDNVNEDEDEPEVRICGLHHGDELMSTELNLNLAWLLVQEYDTDPDITSLVDNREIWIIPMVNPDGRMATPYPTRYNANGVDLNRDYGYMWAGSGGSPSPFSQPETQIIRQHALEHNFVLSLSFHTTQAYVNYLWNYKAQPSPDDAMIQELSDHYAALSGYTAIRGYDWYQTRGDTNDFSYGCRGDIDWTIETGNSDITYTWNKNRQAMLDMIEQTDRGVRGIVTDADTGEPISATIWVEEAYWPVFTDPDVGDYHHVLSPGAYTLHFQANGYQEKIESVTVTSSDEPAILNVALQPNNSYYAHQVTICKYYAPGGNFANNPTDGIHALGKPDQACSSLGKGGELVLDLGADSPVFDLPGEDDLKIIEGDETDDGYSIYIADTWDGPWMLVDSGFGTTTFDLAGTGVEEAQFIKIVDDGDGDAYAYRPGCDIDAVENLAATNANKPPFIPESPSGPSQGMTDITYTFSAVTTDPEEDSILYKFDWGDGTSSEWLGPAPSGIIVSGNKSWNNAGSFSIRVKASDGTSTSAWSQPLVIKIEQGPVLDIQPMKSGLFRVSTSIKNSGAVNATDVHWQITFNGGIFIGTISEGTDLVVPAGEIVSIKSHLFLGFGPTIITTTVEYGVNGYDTRVQNGFVLLFFVKINPSGG